MKKDFADFGLEGLKPNQRGRPISMSNLMRKKRKSEKTFNKRRRAIKRKRKTSLRE